MWDNTRPVFPAIDLHALMASQRRIAREKNKSRAAESSRGKMLNLFDSKIFSSNDLHPLIMARQKRRKRSNGKHNLAQTYM